MEKCCNNCIKSVRSESKGIVCLCFASGQWGKTVEPDKVCPYFVTVRKEKKEK